MNKFKIIGQNLKVFIKTHWLICVGSVSLLILLLIFFPIMRSSWLYYPESLRAKIALKKLADSTESGFYCREDCSGKRLLYKNVISAALANNNKNIIPDLEKVILNPQTLTEIRTLVISLWQTSGRELSKKIKEYYINTNNAFSIRAALASAWPELVDASFNAEIIRNFKIARSDKEKELLLDMLIGKSETLVLETIWDIILGNYSDSLKTKAWFLLANIDNKALAYKESDLSNLRSVLESGDYPHRLKDQAVLVLSDYYLYYPELSEALLVDVINRPQYFDDMQRSFAIDILNQERMVQLPTIELSQADLDAYFIN